MRRRDVLLAFGAAAVAARRADAAPPPLIVGLSPDPTEFTPEYLLTPMSDVMRTHGWQEGRDYVFVSRSTGGDNTGLPAAARELVARGPQVFLAFGDAAIDAAQAETKTIPIVAIADDMVGGHHVASMARPGGNTTGVSILASELDVKRFHLLHQLVPGVHRIGALAETTEKWSLDQVANAARELGLELDSAIVESGKQALAEIRRMKAGGIGALCTGSGAAVYSVRAQVFDLVTELRLPTMYLSPEQAEQGGLIAYGSRFYECYSRVVELAIKVIKGAKPADLPIEQPTKLELAINMKAAKALGLAVPPLLLAQASEVIE